LIRHVPPQKEQSTSGHILFGFRNISTGIGNFTHFCIWHFETFGTAFTGLHLPIRGSEQFRLMSFSEWPDREEIHRKISEYRARADGLKRQANEARVPELRAVYEELAQQWIALGEHLEEALQKTSMAQPATKRSEDEQA
jgi:hypothetical protein